jgi:hypothetical protein
MIFFCNKNSQCATTLEEWQQLFPGKNGKFVKNRSAKEMAKFWLNKGKQEEIFDSISNICNSGDIETCYPEHETRFDNYGEGRNHDLLLISDRKSVIITIEGKADEPFGSSYFYDEIIKAVLKIKNNVNTSMFDRSIDLYNQYYLRNKEVLKLRYQLVHWFAGTLTEAEQHKSDKMIMIVQEFISTGLDQKKLKRNEDDFAEFIAFISLGRFKTISNREMRGPINNKYTREKDLYIMKYQEYLS